MQRAPVVSAGALSCWQRHFWCLPGLLDQAEATMARSQIELLGFVSSVEKICRKGAEQPSGAGARLKDQPPAGAMSG